MSFILDALKKSESERQRQSGPALFEVKVAPPRNRFAIWAVGLGGLLAINLLVVGWMLWRGESSHVASAAAVSATPPTAAASAQGGTTGPSAAESTAAAPITAGAQAHAPPALGSTGGSALIGGAAPDEHAAARVAQGGGAAGTALPATGTHAADSGTAENSTARAADSEADDASPDDLAPAVEPSHRDSQSDGVIRATDSGLPTYQDAEAQPGANIPSLKLDLHVYSPQPDQRFVFLNMMKLHEGDALPRGVRVERITPDGVILSYQGKRFVLLRQ